MISPKMMARRCREFRRFSIAAGVIFHFWDSSANFHNGDQENVALDIMETNSRAELAADLENTDVESWPRARFALGEEFAYGPQHENPAHPSPPGAAYLKQAEKIGRRQAALAAYRLADRLRADLRVTHLLCPHRLRAICSIQMSA
jgi:hypothetical protein